MHPTRKTLQRAFELILPLATICGALFIALLSAIRNWDARETSISILWLLTGFLTSEFIVRLSALSRIDAKLDELCSERQDVELIQSQADVWRRAIEAIQMHDLQIVETTSMPNASEYEARLEEAAAAGATVTRIVCAPPKTHLDQIMIHPTKTSSERVKLLHFPATAPFDFLLIEATGGPKAFIGIRPIAHTGVYDFGLQINNSVAAVRLKTLIEREYVDVAVAHGRKSGHTCQLCREIRDTGHAHA